jgi:hypothetical protein
MYGRADGMPSFQLTVAVCDWLMRFETIVDLVVSVMLEN